MIGAVGTIQQRVFSIYQRIATIQNMGANKHPKATLIPNLEKKLPLSKAFTNLTQNSVNQGNLNASNSFVTKLDQGYNKLDALRFLKHQNNIVTATGADSESQPNFIKKVQDFMESTSILNPIKSTISDFSHLIKTASNKWGVPEPLIRAVIDQESNWKPKAVSKAGAQGLMQLMPTTAKGLGVTDSFDPKQNIDGGTRYLKQMINHFDGDWELGLAAYNAGIGRVLEAGGIPNIKETQNYVTSVLSKYKQYAQTKS